MPYICPKINVIVSPKQGFQITELKSHKMAAISVGLFSSEMWVQKAVEIE
jgi:hypothetical protein